MTQNEIREIFYNFFSNKDHYKVLSASLVPAKDRSLLFTNAGMNQFKSVFLNQEKRDYSRAVSIQKCMRVSGKHNDFDEVGRTDFHHTFFEMMGNFSFGDYFKEKAVEFAWELLTEKYGFSAEDLWITVYKDDDEAADIWRKNIGIKESRIVRLGDKDNFWQMGDTGPCGPCSEIHFDRGSSFGEPDIENNSKRFVEIWNLVFMQYFRNEKGELSPLPAPSIDTGMGLERLTSLLQKKESNYSTDLFTPVIDYTADLCGSAPSGENQVSFNIIADHIRALTFLITDGVIPSNDGRGYVLRRLLRRAARHGRILGIEKPFLFHTVDAVIDNMKDYYPELPSNRDFISKIILSEEERFSKTLANGLKRFEDVLKNTLEKGLKEIPGTELFKLSDTYGFPVDFALDLCRERNLEIDINGYEKELEFQKEKSRKNQRTLKSDSGKFEGLDSLESEFTGYSALSEEGVSVLALYRDLKEVESLKEGENGFAVFSKTPFYAESGGQVGDTGKGRSTDCFFEINDTIKVNNIHLHKILTAGGSLSKGDSVSIDVNSGRRKRIAVHHTSTHLLHTALREVLGLHVKQSGSKVEPLRLRFDFTHYAGLTEGELRDVEGLVNEQIMMNSSVSTDVLPYEEAIARGAIAIFDEKYSDKVRLLTMGDFSKELCGGTHLGSTGEAGFFRIVSESSISSGIRRIEAVAGAAAHEFVNNRLSILADLEHKFNNKAETLMSYFIKQSENIKKLEKSVKKGGGSKVKLNAEDLVKESLDISGLSCFCRILKDAGRDQIRSLADSIVKLNNGIAVIISADANNSALVVAVSKTLTKDYNANNIIREVGLLINGKGGGRPDFAMGGAAKIEDIVSKEKEVKSLLEKMLLK